MTTISPLMGPCGRSACRQAWTITPCPRAKAVPIGPTGDKGMAAIKKSQATLREGRLTIASPENQVRWADYFITLTALVVPSV